MGELPDPLASLKAGKDEFLSRMAPLPRQFQMDPTTRIGIANTEIGITAIVASEMHPPVVYDPRYKRWVQLSTGGDKLIKPPRPS